MAGQQLIEHHAERVNVGGGRDRPAAHLLRAGIRRSHATCTGLSGQRRPRRGLQNLCDPEIQQFRHAVGGYGDVARFQIAVDNPFVVRILYGFAHLAEQV